MLSDYRAWLVSELTLLGNATHHAYSLGQANMAKRALERLDELMAAEGSATNAAAAVSPAAAAELRDVGERTDGSAPLADIL